MARSARDCAALLGVIAGADVNDPTSSLLPVPDYLGQIGLPTAPRIGVDRSLFGSFDQATQDMLDDVVEVLIHLGWPVADVQTPDLRRVAEDCAPLCAVATALAHSETYPSRADEYGADLRDLIDIGLKMSAVELARLQDRRRVFVGRLERVFQGVDLLLMPGVGVASPTLDTMARLGSDADLLSAIVTPTAPFDLAGVPCVTLPGGFTERGTPLAFQFVGAEFTEQLVLQAAHAFQSVTDYHRVHPRLTAPSLLVASS
jgi:amidase